MSEGPSILLCPSGTTFYPFAPESEDIHIQDVAHALSLICRFGGHIQRFYSVAQHSVIVSEVAEANTPGWGLAALLHEVAEALSGLGDVCGPVKRHTSLNGPIKALERGIEDAAATRFDLPIGFASSPEVKAADRFVYDWEDRDLRDSIKTWLAGVLPSKEIDPWDSRRARIMFLGRFAMLTEKRAEERSEAFT